MGDRRDGRALVLALAALTLVGGDADLRGQEVERERVRVRAPRVSVWNSGGTLAFGMSRARLGVSISADQDDLETPGVLVGGVSEDGPAERAGLRRGDVITAVDGQRLTEALSSTDVEEDLDLDRSVPVQRLFAIMRDVEPGDEVEVTYLRDGSEHTATVVTDDRGAITVESLVPRAAPSTFHFFDGDWQSEDLDGLRMDLQGLRVPEVEVFHDGGYGFALRGGVVPGLETVSLNPELGQYFGADEGVLVIDVEENSDLGVEPGDVIVAVDGREVRSTRHLMRVLSSYRTGETLELTIVRHGDRMEIEGAMPRHRRARELRK